MSLFSITLKQRVSMAEAPNLDLGNFVVAFKTKSQKKADLIVRRAMLEFYRRVSLRTPVDTGLARASWGVGPTHPQASPLAEIGGGKKVGAVYSVVGKSKKYSGYKSGKGFKNAPKGMPQRGKAVPLGSQLAGASKAIAGLKFRTGIIGYIFNNVHYIIYLEHGHSKQAPTGMVRITVAEWVAIVNGSASAWPKK